MLTKIIEFSLRQRIIMIIFAISVICIGIFSFISVPIDAYPDISSTQVKIILKAPGMGPTEVENRIVRPLESELLGIEGQKNLRSVSKYAIADITIDFEEGMDIYKARNMVNEKLSNVINDLPPGVSGGMAPITTPLGEMLMFTIEGDISQKEKRELLDFTIRPSLRNIKGVADVNSLGGEARAITIVPNFIQMANLGINISDIEKALNSNLQNTGAGRINIAGESLIVKIQSSVQNINEIAKIPIQTKNGFVRLENFAKVEDEYLTRLGFVTKDGVGEATQGLVLSLKGANAKESIEGIKKRLEEIKPNLPNGVNINIFYDRSNLTQKAVDSVTKVLIEAIVLIVITLFLFLGNVRAAIAVSIILPLALGFAFIMMKIFGMSANLMSLGGLVIAVGMLVDSAVVMVENIFSHLGEQKSSRENSGTLPKLHIVYRAAKEVALPVFSGILIIILFFTPLLTLEGLEGKLFAPVAIAIVFALFGSLILSLTIIPTISSFILKQEEHKDTKINQLFHYLYSPLLSFVLKYSKIVFLGAFCFLAASISLIFFIGSEFMPTLDEGDIILSIETPPSISLSQSKDLNLRIQKQLMDNVGEIKSIIARTGSDEIGLDPMGLNQSDSFIVLKPKDEWEVKTKEEIQNKIKEALSDFKGISFGFTQPIEMRTSEMLTGARGDVAIKIFGSDIDELNNLSNQISSLLSNINGSSEIFTTLNEGFTYLQIEPDRASMANLGIDVMEFWKFLQASLDGVRVINLPQDFKLTPVLIRMDSTLQDDIDKFKTLELVSNNGNAVPITSFTKITQIDGPVQVNRENTYRMSVVRSNVEGRDLGGYVDEVKQKINEEITLPDGYRIEYGGQFENQQRASKKLMTIIPLSIIVIFFILFFTFKSISISLLILLNIPFAITGGLIALFVSGEYISVPASVGFIALFGIAVLNGLVMVSYFISLLKQGYSLNQAVEVGAKRRLRPVLMTAFIAGLGLIPLLLSSGVGSEVQRPLAIVILGGLVTSSILTLLILPPMFIYLVKKVKLYD
ncbi:efflux RND transporter permease subunit [Helicobacter sp. MIT 14-3879]|uniref:efflux RND transporter permease subunit n=1 Tax=Helicobacter sp. MIT 14-3879 TaxID=2040649 RepID=UPI000E1F3D3E|nr:efflux RND transporter permease subunit [Helicobacter sp. MIT 14-3879]RDU65556.1 CusA/CzcA family heavy metal efflux RND transporter [Helicobacter sp. MIT 14-3879]